MLMQMQCNYGAKHLRCYNLLTLYIFILTLYYGR
jgi:hypothetical protein